MPRYYWWDGADLEDFFDEVAELGVENVRIRFDPKQARLYVDPKDNVDDEGAVVIQSHEEGHEGYNFTHTCPPDC